MVSEFSSDWIFSRIFSYNTNSSSYKSILIKWLSLLSRRKYFKIYLVLSWQLLVKSGSPCTFGKHDSMPSHWSSSLLFRHTWRLYQIHGSYQVVSFKRMQFGFSFKRGLIERGLTWDSEYLENYNSLYNNLSHHFHLNGCHAF